MVEAGRADRELVRQRNVHRAFEATLVEAAVLADQVAARFLLGLPGNDVQNTARGVAAVQGALGPAQHLHALGVEEADIGHARPGEVDVVLVGGNARVPADALRLGGNAPERNLAGRNLADDQAGHVQRQVGDVLNGAIDQGLSLQRGQRGDYILPVFVAPLCRDENLLEFQRLGARFDR